MDPTLDALVRRNDEDRWLSARFAPQQTRNRLIALYAVNFEIARTSEMVTEGALGEMRLQFWRDTIEAIYAGADLPAPTLLILGLKAAIEETQLPRAAFDAMIAARESDLSEVPFATWDDLDTYIDATAGAIADLAVKACAPDMIASETQTSAIQAAGRAWGFCGLVRALPHWTKARRTFFPKKLLDHAGIRPADVYNPKMTHGPSSAVRSVLDRAVRAMEEARRLSSSLPTAAFPAIAYVTLVPHYAELLTRTGMLAGAEGRRLGPFKRRFALINATARGRL